MADLPIQLKFFQKLDLYQELKFLNEKSRESNQFKILWKREKEILRWAAWEHHKLASPLDHAKICKEVYASIFTMEKQKEQKKSGNMNVADSAIANAVQQHIGSLSGVTENMIERGFARQATVSNGIIITKLGFLMGEVIRDYGSYGYKELCNKNNIRSWGIKKTFKIFWRKVKYPIFIILVWAVVISTIIIAISQAVKIIIAVGLAIYAVIL